MTSTAKNNLFGLNIGRIFVESFVCAVRRKTHEVGYFIVCFNLVDMMDN